MKSKKSEKYISITQRGKAWRVRVRVAPFCNTATFDTEHEARSLALVEKSRQVLDYDRRPPGFSSDAAAALHSVPNRVEEIGREIGIRPSSASDRAMPGVLVSTMLKSYVKHVSPRKASGSSDRARARKLIAHFWRKPLHACSLRDFEDYIKLRRSGHLGQGRRHIARSRESPKAAHRRGSPRGIEAKVRLAPDDGTIRHEIVLFRRALKDWIKRNGLLESCRMLLTTHACFLVDLPRKAKPRTRRLSDDEISRILAAVGNALMRACICFHSLTSLRRSEVVSLRWEDYDRKRNVILLREPGFVRAHGNNETTADKSKTHEREEPLIPGPSRS